LEAGFIFRGGLLVVRFLISIFRSSSNSFSANQSFLAMTSISAHSLAASTRKISNSSNMAGVGEFFKLKNSDTLA